QRHSGAFRWYGAVLGVDCREPLCRAPLRAAGDPLAALVFPGSGARSCGRAPDSPPRPLRPRDGGGGARLRVRRPAPVRRPLPHQLRHVALQDPDPGEQLLLVRRHRAARCRTRLRDAARGARARQPRHPLVGRAAPEPAQGLLLRRGRRARAAGPGSCDDAARAAADVGAVRRLDLARGVRRAAGCEARGRGGAGMTRAEWTRLGGFSGGVVLLHVLGFGLFLYYLPRNPALTGLATLAYTFGLRHAFDADHIAAIDNTTRKLLQDGKRPLGTGFFFSLGHSTIVFLLASGLPP